MKRALPAYVYAKRGVLYFQRRGWDSVRIEAAPNTPEFALEYARILNGSKPTYSGQKTFQALVVSYCKSARYTKLAPRTKADYQRVLDWVKTKLGTLPADKMQRKDVIRARDANADSVRFANYIVQVLRILMEHAHDLGWRDDNPAKGVSLITSDKPKRTAWPDDMVAAFRATAAPRPRLIFELCIGTGQRIGDVLRMRWSDIEGGQSACGRARPARYCWCPSQRPCNLFWTRRPASA